MLLLAGSGNCPRDGRPVSDKGITAFGSACNPRRASTTAEDRGGEEVAGVGARPKIVGRQVGGATACRRPRLQIRLQ